jgi:poly(3-hydroxybutyrate) depolymerase
MLYQFFQPIEDAADVGRISAGLIRSAISHLPSRVQGTLPARAVDAACQLAADTRLTHTRPSFGIDHVVVDDTMVAVVEEAADRTPFGTLLHFRKDSAIPQPKVLVVAPLSGHFATLLRPTVRTLLADHDVYITDWHNARDVPLEAGRFGFEDYVSHVIRFIEAIDDDVHLVAVCQPCVPALVAAAVMAESGHPAQPRSLTLMAGPVDARINPTAVNDLATSRPLEWFERNVVATVPARFPGGGRRVYPGFLQIAAFMSMNMERHLGTHIEMLGMLTRGEATAAAPKRSFYDEYFAVLDIPAEFYLETVGSVFQRFELARGVMTYQSRRVNPGAMRRTALMTVEGDRDDICAVGQTLAAQDLCRSVLPARRQHHLQAGVGHYGVFSGTRWERQIYPRLRHFVLASS